VVALYALTFSWHVESFGTGRRLSSKQCIAVTIIFLVDASVFLKLSNNFVICEILSDHLFIT